MKNSFVLPEIQTMAVLPRQRCALPCGEVADLPGLSTA